MRQLLLLIYMATASGFRGIPVRNGNKHGACFHADFPVVHVTKSSKEHSLPGYLSLESPREMRQEHGQRFAPDAADKSFGPPIPHAAVSAPS